MNDSTKTINEIHDIMKQEWPNILLDSYMTQEFVEDQTSYYNTMIEDYKKKIAALNAAMTLKRTMKNLIPGYFYVDASDYLPKEKWRAFISNDKQEWIDWLVENGVDKEIAIKLTEEALEKSKKN